MGGPPFIRSSRGLRAARLVLVVIAIVLAALAAPASATHAAGAVGAPRALAAHAPIDIEGNAGFTPANGVVSGQGTAANPYLIAGWSISSPLSIGFQIRNADAHAVVRDVEVTGAPVDGFYFYRVSNLTLVNVTAYFNPGEGIRFESSGSSAVLASNLTGNLAGLVVLNSANLLVRGTNFTINAGDGATITGSPNVTLQGNAFAYNALGGPGHGIDLSYTSGDTIAGNRFTANGIFLAGDSLSHFNSHTIPPDNLVSGLPILYAKDCNGLGLAGMQLGQLLLAGCLHARVSNLSVAGGDVGVEVAFANDAILGPGVTASDSSVGILIQESTSVQVVDSQLLDTSVGVQVDGSTAVRILRTKIAAPFAMTGPYDGVAIRASDRVNLTGNIIRHHRYAVAVVGSGNVSLVNNVVGFNVLGLNFSASRDLLVIGNLLTQDTAGMRLQNVMNATVAGNGLLAILTTGANVTGSSGVRFVRNAFGGVRDNAYDAQGASDAWDGGYPVGGNFWANYAGVDQFHGPFQNLAGPDGIGDTAYRFNVNAVDRYPLMSSPVTRDVPPEAVIFVTPAAGTVVTPFSLTANLSSDFEDALSRLQVRWSWDDGISWTAWTTTKSAFHVFGTPGVRTISLEVQDTAGLTDASSVQVLVLPKPDALPPAIVYTPLASAAVGQGIPIRANITDPSGIANATLLYRGVDGGPFQPVSMEIGNDGRNFTATIPAQPHVGTVEYVIVANDTWANEARAPVAGASSIRIVDTFTPLVVGLALAGGLLSAVAVAFLLLRRRRKRTQGGPPPETPARPPGNP